MNPTPDSVPARALAELQRVRQGPGAHDEAELVVVVHAWCGRAASEVLQRAREVMTDVLADQADGAGRGLPDWFTARCERALSVDEEDRWLDWWESLDGDALERASATTGWSVTHWLEAMSASDRAWRWWDAQVVEDLVLVAVAIEGWPHATGPLEWLLKAAGATSVCVD